MVIVRMTQSRLFIVEPTPLQELSVELRRCIEQTAARFVDRRIAELSVFPGPAPYPERTAPAKFTGIINIIDCA